MKKRVFSWALVLSLLLALSVPALAAAEPEPTPEPEYRLAKVVSSGSEYTFTYGQGGYLPTEILQNGASYVTAAYDDAGRCVAFQNNNESSAHVFDAAGNCVREEYTSNSGYSFVTEYTYDESGNRVRGENADTENDGTVTTSVTEYTYDEAGNCVRKEFMSDSGYSYVTEYIYDEAGNCVQEKNASDYGDGNESTKTIEYAYDEKGRMLSVTTDDNGVNSEAVYTYSEDDGSTTKTDDNSNIYVDYNAPLLDVSWENSTDDFGDGTSYTTNECRLMLRDNTDSILLFMTRCSCDSEPTLTYDDNGYLVRVDGADGSSIELTYEPVA